MELAMGTIKRTYGDRDRALHRRLFTIDRVDVGLRRNLEAISNQVICDEIDRVCWVRFEFLPQLPNEKAKGMNAFLGVRSPKALRQFPPRHGVVHAQGQLLENAALSRRQPDLPVSHSDGPSLQINDPAPE